MKVKYSWEFNSPNTVANLLDDFYMNAIYTNNTNYHKKYKDKTRIVLLAASVWDMGSVSGSPKITPQNLTRKELKTARAEFDNLWGKHGLNLLLGGGSFEARLRVIALCLGLKLESYKQDLEKQLRKDAERKIEAALNGLTVFEQAQRMGQKKRSLQQ